MISSLARIPKQWRISGSIDNMEIGGRNYLLLSDEKAESTNYMIREYEAFAPLVAGAMFTISMCVTPADGVWMSVSA